MRPNEDFHSDVSSSDMSGEDTPNIERSNSPIDFDNSGMSLIDKINSRIANREIFYSLEFFPPRTKEGAVNLLARLVIKSERPTPILRVLELKNRYHCFNDGELFFSIIQIRAFPFGRAAILRRDVASGRQSGR